MAYFWELVDLKSEDGKLVIEAAYIANQGRDPLLKYLYLKTFGPENEFKEFEDGMKKRIENIDLTLKNTSEDVHTYLFSPTNVFPSIIAKRN